jgi:hypothetical protein
MNTTFLNGDSEHKQKGLDSLQSVKEDFEIFMQDTEGNDETGSFYDYGLSFDFVDAGTFNDQERGYYRFQFSWGGPSDELRIYQDGTLEYVYLDWFVGVGFNVTHEEWAQWIEEFFTNCMSIDWDSLSPEQLEIYEEEEEV